MGYKSAMKTAIDLISISVRTAHKSGGVDDVVFLAVSDRQKNRIAREMIRIGKDRAKGANKAIRKSIETSWSNDARAVKKSQGLILIAVRGKKPLGSNCGGCGFKSCAEFQAHNAKNKNNKILGPFCIFKIWDLGIAICSAAKTASALNVDNRIMYRIGTAVERLSIFKKVSPALGLPLSESGKNIYFDRFEKLEAAKVLTDYFKHRR